MAHISGLIRSFSLFLAIAALAPGCGTMGAAPSSAAQSESITNNQEAGVDEGGIVKAWGDYLVVLRRGRLFTVRVGDQDLTPVSRVDAYPVQTSRGTWYDEMLIHDRTVVVVGYSYQERATEIGLFGINDRGGLRHRATYFLRSNDYFSTRNYASRLVDGRLVFYMPHRINRFQMEDGQLHSSVSLPTFRRYGGGEGGWRPIIAAADIHVPAAPTSTPTLHTVFACDLRAPELACRAHGMVGSFGRTFYVSPRAVYVWVHEGRSRPGSQDRPAVVYRLPLEEGSPGALRAWGVPTDQFSFREDDSGHLNVLVRGAGGGDWMGGPEHSAGSVALARIPLSAFAGEGHGTVSQDAYTALPRPEGGHAFQNRFVGEHVLYGTGVSWGWAHRRRRADLYIHPYRYQGETARLTLPHGVDRIEALGRDAMIIGTDGRSLHFSSVALGALPNVIDRFTRPGASQGELRSHGFFYRSDQRRHGVLGLPVRRGGPGYAHLYRGSAEILYLEVDQLQLHHLGALAARDDRVDDRCVVSCVDWYGNARPVFYRGRVFALLGYELVEGVIRQDRIVEVARAHLIRDQQG